MRKRCNKCMIDLNTQRKTCPICFDLLIDIEESEYTAYPCLNTEVKITNVLKKTLVFILFSISILCLLINLLSNRSNMWSFIVIASCLVVFMFIVSIFSNNNVLIKINNIILSLFLIFLSIDLVDLNITHSWQITYALPFITIASIVINYIIYFSNKKLYYTSFLLIVFTALQTLIPVFIYLVFKDLFTSIWPIYMCLAVCVLCIIALFVFRNKEEMIEIKKRIHTK